LAELDVAQTHLLQGFELSLYRRHRPQEGVGFVYAQLQNVGNTLASVKDLQRLAIVTAALAFLAGDVHIGEKVHFNADDAIAFARFTASPFHIEREAPSGVATRPGVGKAREQISNEREEARVRRGVGTWRTPDGRLVDVD